MSLYKIVQWSKENGDERVVNRIQVFCLSSLVKEKISLLNIEPSTQCTDACLQAVRDAAAKVVGKPCPF